MGSAWKILPVTARSLWSVLGVGEGRARWSTGRRASTRGDERGEPARAGGARARKDRASALCTGFTLVNLVERCVVIYMSTIHKNTVSRIRTPNRRPLRHPVTVSRRPDIPGVAVETCSAARTTVDRRLVDPVATRGAHPVASNWRADDPVAAVLRSAALLWGHDLLTHPFSHFDTNFLHPAARIRAFSSCSWKGKKFSVIEAKLGVFFWGGMNLRASVGRNFLSDERLSFLR